MVLGDENMLVGTVLTTLGLAISIFSNWGGVFSMSSLVIGLLLIVGGIIVVISERKDMLAGNKARSKLLLLNQKKLDADINEQRIERKIVKETKNSGFGMAT